MRWKAFVSVTLSATFCQASWKASGEFKTYFSEYSFSPAAEYSNQSGGLETELKLDWKKQNTWRFRSQLELKADFLTKDQNSQIVFNPRQLHFENKTTPITARLGYQTLQIDGPDLVNPADVVHQRNLTDPTNPKTLSSFGLSFSQEWEEWQWEAFFIPAQSRPILPGAKSAWLPRENRLPLESENLELRIPGEIRYQYGDSFELNDALKNNIAFKLQRKSEAFEAQVLYFEGLSSDPHVTVDVVGTALSTPTNPTPQNPTVILLDSPVVLHPIFIRQRAVAGTFLVPMGTWVMRGGANTVQPLGQDEKKRIPQSSQTFSAGFEKNVETRKGLMTLLLQHQQQKRASQEEISFLRPFFENSWSFGARVPWGEDLTFMVGAIFDSVGKSSAVRFSASQRIKEVWTLDLEGQWLQGPPDTLLGLYDDHDRVGSSLTFHW